MSDPVKIGNIQISEYWICINYQKIYQKDYHIRDKRIMKKSIKSKVIY